LFKLFSSYKLFSWVLRLKFMSALADKLDYFLLRARCPIPGDLYLCRALTSSLLVTLSTALALSVARFLCDFLVSLNVFFVLIPLIAFAASMLSYIFYPYYLMISRRSRIDGSLYHACAFLYAMTKSGLEPIEALKALYERRDVYGAVAEELGIAVRRCEALGESLYSALQYVSSTTSSKKLRDFLDSLVTTAKESATLSTLFKGKFYELFDEYQKSLETISSNLNLLGEIVVVLLALAPSIILATLFTIGFLNPEVLSWGNVYVSLLMPILTFSVIAYVKAVCPTERTTKATKAVYYLPMLQAIPLREERGLLKEVNKVDKSMSFSNALRNPLLLFFVYPWFVLLSGHAMLLTLLFLLRLLVGMSIEAIAVYGLIGSCAIFSIWHEVRLRYVLAVERRLPDFLKNLAEAVDKEGSLVKAIERVLSSRLGVLRREFSIVQAHSFGVSLRRSLQVVEHRTASTALQRVVSLLVKASESAKNLKDILLMAAADAEAHNKVRRIRFLSLLGYMAATYVCFIVYLFVYKTISQALSSAFTQYPAYQVTALTLFSSTGQYLSYALAVSLGIMVGILLEGSMLSGLKHSIVMLAAALLFLGGFSL